METLTASLRFRAEARPRGLASSAQRPHEVLMLHEIDQFTDVLFLITLPHHLYKLYMYLLYMSNIV